MAAYQRCLQTGSFDWTCGDRGIFDAGLDRKWETWLLTGQMQRIPEYQWQPRAELVPPVFAAAVIHAADTPPPDPVTVRHVFGSPTSPCRLGVPYTGFG